MENILITGLSYGQGCDLKLHSSHGTALEYDGLVQTGGPGQSTYFDLRVINSVKEFSSAINVGIEGSFAGIFSGSASANFVEESSLNIFSTFVMVKCIVLNAPHRIRNPRPIKEVNEWIADHTQEEFEEKFGREYLCGEIQGGYYYGIIDISGTTQAEKTEISSAISGAILSAKLSASFVTRLQQVTRKKSLRVRVISNGGDPGPIPVEMDEMITQARNFPQSVQTKPVGLKGIYETYKDTIIFNNHRPSESPEKRQKRRDDLNHLANRYMDLIEERGNVDFIRNNLTNSLNGTGTKFVGFEDDTPSTRASMDRLMISLEKDYENINGLIEKVIKAADNCRYNLPYKIPELLRLESTLPHLTGENMDYKNVLDKLSNLENNTVPSGTIVMWSGTISNINPNWVLCDGNNKTPDLRDRFVVGSGGKYAPGSTGGLDVVRLTTNEIPSHTHNLTDPGHSHRSQEVFAVGATDDDDKELKVYVPDPRKGHALHLNTVATGITVANTGGNQSHENLPPYYALCYIMKL
ncbi:MAG: hypothetical protein HQL73_08240 [Magnetococcales bacterium]|nr:hypothetical protein [Magnetococcales bacterium]